MSAGTFLEDYRPATFLERGVATPFTTPVLAAARVRPSRRLKLEFVIANPSGGMGWYVMPWEGLMTLSKVSVHDVLLFENIGKQELITPYSIRSAARSVAASGAAGRAALKAARAAEQREEDDRLIANFLLIMRLLKAAGAKDIDWRTLDPTDRNLKVKMRGYIERLQPALGATPETIYWWLEELSAIVAPVGFASKDYPARLQTTADSLKTFQRTMQSFANTDGTDAGLAARFIAEIAKHTSDLADATFQDCHAELNDLQQMLRNWANTRDRVLERFGRPDWLLDGWQSICAIWEDATAGGRDAQRAAAVEIQRMVPIMPKEVTEWVDGANTGDQVWQFRRWVKGNVDWRTGAAALDRVARNEALRARAA